MLLHSPMEVCEATNRLIEFGIGMAVFIGVLLILCILQDRGLRKAQLTNPTIFEQEKKTLEIAHELEDVMHECGRVPHYQSAYLDPILTMYTVGRVSRIQLHSAITDWLKRGTDYRLEENQFWKKK